ncbi:hypothetical protein IC006_2379 [Sulfuracidifex tepidarius]|uniref:Uncharacterized protein n=1 Tax=Sulfuracidifex tepidarius TaxID=1294262 RepID=A0A510DXU4_9CREN|nr:hypothetical protein [Sulfuracidifex tepidarius]BBG25044.1 hypothetical protein IC006_2379 [Sulfuracidifex tepidarius]
MKAKSTAVIVLLLVVAGGVVSFFTIYHPDSSSIPSSSSSSSTSREASSTRGEAITSSSPTPSDSVSEILLYNSGGTFTVLGHHQSDSAYSMAEAYTPDASLMVSPFVWNMKVADGYVNMTYDGPTLNVDINMTHFQKITPSIGVNGYPGVMYGQECWFPFAGRTVESPLLELPAPVESLPYTDSCLSYSLWLDKGSIDDFSYDIWMSQDPNTTYLKFPDVEIMIWLYHQEEITSKYFVNEGTFTVPGVVNGTPENMTFSVYVLPHTGSGDGWIGVYYVSQQEMEGKVTVPLTTMVQGSFPFMEKIFKNMNESTYYLDAVQVGMEFNNDSAGTALMGYSLYNWTIQVG